MVWLIFVNLMKWWEKLELNGREQLVDEVRHKVFIVESFFLKDCHTNFVSLIEMEDYSCL